ncbi:LysR family transcriptional regulator [Sporolactobacillus sp. CPB3-1]|uniref:LysR family transcriptional regulator n=1 Tax=Sporolactobacillus mangiferae TaxID=2940498 RepID=A0ABT0MCN8_9BACL|nr:LysR family transcriptional regulator [Sporolactobacillus mangiferae]MCL1632646.1 LysR family transcriptional regulator [Sporolactobacillus mangiferae]
MSIEQIETFLAVVRHNGFRHASRKLFLTQPSVSMRIQMLEKELNASLFIRKGRKIALSDQGKALLPYAENILHIYREAVRALRTHSIH